MGAVDGRTWLEHLEPAPSAGCSWTSTPVGRVGVLNDSAPEIYPVNHVVDRDTIVFRTDPGSTSSGASLRSPAVCYQVDGIVPDDATGWSVLVKGRAIEVDDADELRGVARAPAATTGPWGDKAPLDPDPARRRSRAGRHLEPH